MLTSKSRRNAPSRLRPRPTTQLTFAEALATWGAINLGSSVLGAVGTLWKAGERVNPENLERVIPPASSSRSSIREYLASRNLEQPSVDGPGCSDGKTRSTKSSP
jgi:hypothetical protein